MVREKQPTVVLEKFALYLLLFIVVNSPARLFGQEGDRRVPGKPLDGTNSIGLTMSALPTVSTIEENVLPSVDSTGRIPSARGIGWSTGIQLSRYLPDLFLKFSTTVVAQLRYSQIPQTTEIDGAYRVNPGDQSSPLVPVHQSTTTDIQLISAGLSLEFDVIPYRSFSPIVVIGADFGHITGVTFETVITPADIVPLTDLGLPATGDAPLRRYFFADIRLGAGLRINLGKAGSSVALVPHIAGFFPTTSFTRSGNFWGTGMEGGVDVRIPL